MAANLIAIVAAVVAIVAVYYNYKAIEENTKTRQLGLFDGIFSRIIELEKEQPPQSADEELKKDWRSRFFNTLEYLSYLVNKNYLNTKMVVDFYGDAIIVFYEEIFLCYYSEIEIKDEKFFPEFKKFYRQLKSAEC